MSNLHTKAGKRPASSAARSRNGRWVVATTISAVAVLFIFGLSLGLLPRANREQVGNPSTTALNSSSTSDSQQPRLPESSRDRLVEDDGRTLWASPTRGEPLDLSYLPLGTQIVVSLRPAALAEHSEGAKLRAALGPLGERAIQSVEQAMGVPFDQIEQLVVGMQVTSEGTWRPTYVLRAEPAAIRAAVSKIVEPTQESQGGETYWLAEDRAYLVPRGHDEHVAVVTPADAIEEIIKMGGPPPPLQRDIERVLANTDADRDVTILFAPYSLYNEGRSMFDGPMSRLRQSLFWFLGDELSAAALSFHWSEDFFAELAAAPSLDTSPERAAQILRERLNQVPDRVEEYISGLNVSSYGKPLVERCPAMLRLLVQYTRSGFDSDHAVLRSYLPIVAGHNLLMAAELTLAEQPGASIARSEAIASTPPDAESLAKRLQRPASLQFARDTLEAALDQLSQDIGVSIVIEGADLQAEGITKNQSFGIDLVNRPAGDILVEILQLANPDKTAAGPADPRQKLVYLFKNTGEAGADQIIITTRTAATRRGDELPAVFSQPEQ